MLLAEHSSRRGRIMSILLNIDDVLSEAVDRWPENILIAGADGALRYKDFSDAVGELSVLLESLGVEPGDRIAVVLPNIPEALLAWFALARLRAVIVPLNPLLTPVEAEPLLCEVGVRGLIGQAGTVARYSARLHFEVKAVVGSGGGETVSFVAAAGAVRKTDRSRADDLAAILQTSGTSGLAKAAALSHASYVLPAQEFVRWMQVVPGDRFLTCLPLFHLAGQAFAISAIAGGATLVLVDQFSARNFWAQVREHRITIARHLGEMLAALCRQPRRSDDRLHTLRAVYGGGARHDVAEEFERRFGAAVVEGYGLTETNTVLRNELGRRRRGSIGCALPYCEVRIADDGGRPVPDFHPGEIQVRRNPVMMRGYIGPPAATEACFMDGWFRTGDLGYRDPDGYFYFLGRSKEIIRRRGENIYPAKIEQLLDGHPAIAHSAVVGVPDGLGGEEIKAFLVCRPGASVAPEALAEWCRGFIAEFEIPRYFEVCDALPRTSTNKIDKSRLRTLGIAGSVCYDRAASARPPLPAERGGVEDGADPGLDRDGLLSLPADQRWPALLAALRQALSRIGRMPAARIDPAEPLARLGLDSLGAVELGQLVERAFGLPLSPAHLLGGLDLASLGRELLDGLEREPEPRRSGRSVPAGTDLPLSHGQRALWFLARLAPQSGAYHIVAAARVRPAVDVPALGRALTSLVRRHPALRTTFTAPHGEPVQQVHPELAPDLRAVDGTAWSAAELEDHLLGEAYRPFDLAAGPLLRVGLVRRSGDEGVVLLAIHHMVADFWSLAVLTRELGALYAEETGGPAAALELPATTCAEHALRQKERLAGAEGEALWDYWRGRLAAPLPVLELPADRLRPPAQTYAGDALFFRLAPDLSAALTALAGSARTTPFTALLAGFMALLHRWTGQEDLLVGSPTAGRSRAELAGVIGYFVNPVVLRADLSGAPGFGDLLARLRGDVLAAVEHQDYPFPLLAARLQPERDPSRPPLVQAMFALHRARPAEEQALAAFAVGAAGARLSFGGLELESLALPERACPFELVLRMAELGGTLAASFQYNTDLFDRATIRRLAGHFTNLLAGAVADPGRRLAELPLLSAAERTQLLVEWNDTAAEPAETWIDELVAAQAERRPGAWAVVSAEAALSYADLAARAGGWADLLAARGVGPEAVVALLFDRSADLVVAALAVLEAGGAYLPIDPALPAERIAFLLADSGARLLLTGREGARLVPSLPLEVVVLEDGRAGEGEHRCHRRERPRPEGLAYVIYTSGSTGVPKGTQLCHAGLANLVAWHRAAYGVTAADRACLVAGVGFDAAVWEIWPYLAAGAGLWVPPAEVVASPAKLLRWLADHAITCCFLPTPLAELVLAEPLPPGLSLRWLLTGGDRLHLGAPEEAAFQLVNHYGPTESTVVATCIPVSRGSGLPPIGRPIANTRVFLLDRCQQPVPPGTPGELCIAGAGLARGYLGRPELTAGKFLPDPWSGQPGGRLYRTGDLARWRPDGALDFLGRLDHQVKVRGLRIELGEIEALLAAQPGVAEAVVLAQQDAAVGPRLVAYVVPAAGLDLATLPLDLAGKLPEAMIPSLWVPLPELPRTPNGKVDRQALPAPAGHRAGLTAGYVAPRTPVEELLAGIFEELLGVGRVGAHDSFFELGGHSLLAARLSSRLREPFGVELPLQVVFEHPTVAALAAAIERARGREGEAAPPLLAVPREGALPLSPAQERLWFLDRLAPDDASYNIPAAVRLEGGLDTAALAAGLSALARRHEPLRTRFAIVAGAPVQVVAPPAPVPLPTVDLGGLERAGREAEARRLAESEARRPFDLAAGPLLRALLLRLGRQEHLLVLDLHHIVADGWSLGVLLDEVSELYGAAAEGRRPELAPLPVQYGDFALWQRRWLTGEVLDRELRSWREQLAGAPEVLELPCDRPRPAVQSSRGGVVPAVLPPELDRRLAALSRQSGTTRFMTLLAGFAALLGRLSGQDDLVVGTPVACRDRAEIEGLIGFFVNLLPLRIGLAGDPPFAELLGRVRETALAAYAHQAVPFERLVEELAPRRDRSRTPLFQVVLALQPDLAGRLRLPGIAARPVDLHAGTAKFDLTLALGEGLAGGIEFSADLFDAATVRRLWGHLTTLLAGAAAAPDLRLGELPLLSAAERAQLLVEWNAQRQEHPREQGLHELFEEQARRAPEAAALIWRDQRLEYGELDRRAERLAALLRGLGVGPEVLVGIFTTRRPEMVVALLAVLKAGGAYLPLDPAYPAERVSFLLADGGAPVIVTERSLAGSLPEYGGRVVLVDGQEAAADRPAGPRVPCHPEQLAYAIYTSGSTGVPKGVAIRHGSAMARVSWGLASYPPERLRGVLASTSICFDLSVFELFVPLSAGGTAVLVDDALSLLEPVGAPVTLVNTVPSAMSELLRAGAVPASVRTVNLAGEPLRRELVERLYGLEQIAEVHNLYGPSEDTTYSTGCLVERGGRGEPTIGRPLPNTRAYVLDSGFRPLPVGVAGELWLGGDGLARGYLGRPHLTAERFRPDPFGQPGGRLYRTGDHARVLPGGEIAFLGRLDHQVKVRGFRIELGEVEACLLRQPGVEEAVVVAREDGAGGSRLVAYVVPAGGAELSGLPEALRQSLPGHMVPSAWVALPGLPRTPSGKVDRGALPEPSRPVGADRPAAPRTPAEELLAALWADLLGVEQVSAEDDFFAVGGHSLLAARLVWRLREPFGVDLPLQAVFERPTLAGLAAAIEQARGQAGMAAPPLRAVPREGPLPLSPAQERLWFLDQLEPGNATYNIPVAVRLEGRLDQAALAASLSAVALRHESLRTRFAVAAGEPVQVVAPPAPVPLPEVDLAGLVEEVREAEAGRLAEGEAGRPFDLAAGPLLRTLLLRLDRQEHLLVVDLHHIVADGWSLGVLLEEVSELYAAAVEGRRPELAPLPIQYGDFAVWQRRQLAGEALESDLCSWRERLRGAPEALELPCDRPRPAVQSPRGGYVPAELPAELERQLAGLSRQSGTTRFMTLLAGFAALLGRLSGQEDLVVGAPVAGRDRSETGRMIGFFVNLLPLRVDLTGDPPFAVLLGRVRETALGAYAHQAVPFERLVEEVSPRRDRSRGPLFQAILALQPDLGGKLRLPGVAARLVGLHTGTAKLDLTLALGAGQPGGIEYSADLFDAATIRRWWSHLTTLLAGAVAAPQQRLGELPLLSAAERVQLLVEWNETATGYPRDSTIHELFEEQARRCPDRIALIAGSRELTYGELDARAGLLAGRLRAWGVGPETPVAFCLRRSLEMVVATLAILKAGGAYVPLDPTSPRERLNVMLADARAGIRTPLLLTEAELAARLDRVEEQGWRKVVLDEPADAAAPSLTDRPRARAGSLAYVMYTSGSTGRPKGVAVPHRGVVRLVRETGYARFGPDEVFLQLAPVSFDAATLEIWGALLHGGRLVLMPPETPSLADLGAAVARHGVTTLWLTAGLFHQVVEEELEGLAPVRQLLAGGDSLSPGHVRRVRRELPGTRLINGYGPTEGTTFTCCWAVEEDRLGASVPIGRPIANTRVSVLDGAGRPAPVGVPGELWISGDGLARGYFQAPDLTAERFRPHPLPAEAGERLYRTGDRVRWLSDGRLEFLGRLDRQVKVRGHRVEPAEIEAVLSAHPEIAEAVVAVREDVPGDKRLVAYVVPRRGGDELSGRLRGYLRERLPEPMVPAAVLILDALPLNPNGKVDHRALPAPAGGRPDLAATYVAPRTPIEELLAGIFQELLGVEQVGVHDSFFELGGHSLQGIRLISRVRDAFAVDLEVQALFDAPTVAGLAVEVAGRLVEEADQDLVSEMLAELEREGTPFSSIPSLVEELCDSGVSAGQASPGMTPNGR